ncbi:MAG TPA: hypothetical protein VF585_05280 [Chthoniobacterales bacterium]
MKRWLLLFLSLALILVVRLWNHEQIFVDGQIYFVDADCYSRMTRVAAVMAHPGKILRHHDFENWPIGTTPHTTAVFDYVIAAVAWVCGNRDLAGAVVPILLALAAGGILWKWVAQFRWITQIGVLFTFAVSPILVHGTVLGRPDHQALLIFLVVGALATEWTLQRQQTKTGAVLNGLAWGFALWTSLFEPTVLLLAAVLLGIASHQRSWFTRARAISAMTLAGVLLVALAIERWHVGPLPTGPLFDRWSKSIGELAPMGWFSKTYLSWLGLAVLVLPAALLWRIFREKERSSIVWGGLFFLMFVLCTTAARWGYFLAIAFLFALPFLLEKWRAGWVAALFFVGFWPVASEWDARLWPAQAERERLAEQREDYRQLRQICEPIRNSLGGVIAPWWLSPPIAYWTGANCVAGSSHQSLPGTEDVAHFYLSRFPEKAREILQRRQVAWVIGYEPSRVLSTASALVDIPPANDAFGATLYMTPKRVPAFLKLQQETPFFKLYRVAEGS